MLKYKNTDPDIRYLHKMLGMHQSNYFDLETLKKVKQFQKEHSLLIDGIVGPKTWNTLKKEYYRNRRNNKNILTRSNLTWFIKQVGYAYPVRNQKKVKSKLMRGLSFSYDYMPDSLKRFINMTYIMGQMREEGGNGLYLSESLNYSAEALIKTFSFYKHNPYLAKKHGRTAFKKANQPAIANHAYAHRMGNGSPKSGDGWKYRGRGGNGLTGKDNYYQLQKWIDNEGININVIEDPDLLSNPTYFFLPVIMFYEYHRLNKIIHNNINKSTCDKITRVYNKYTDSYYARWLHTKRIAIRLHLL